MNVPYIDTYINKVDNIEPILANKNIEVKKDGPYMLLKYGITADFSDAVVQQCRGIIYKKENGRYICVCRPFDKFFNYQESNAAEIDWSSARVQEKVDGCFTGSDKVLLADGTSREIKTIVNNKQSVEVLSYNFNTGQVEPKKVCGWKKSKRLASLDEWRTIYLKQIKTSLNGKLSQHCIITPTYNHIFFREDSQGKIEEIEARYLKKGDTLYTTKYGLTEIEKQVALGTLLGDGSCTYYQVKDVNTEKGIRFTHSRKQKEYVEFKAKLLVNLGGKISDIEVSNSFNPSKTKYITNVHSGITEIYNICYQNYHKRVSEEWLKNLDWLGFAIWYMDDGHLDKAQVNNSISLHTEGFSDEENLIIHDYYNSLGYKNYIRDDKKGHYYIHFSTKASESIWQNIRQYIPDCMQYKLPVRHQGYYIEIENAQERPLILTKGYIEKIEEGLHAHNPYKAQATTRYDIEVEDNHNYFCQGVLVHNSLIKLWYDGYWHWSTNGVIDAFKSPLGNLMSFGELIKKADNYIDVNLNTLDNRYTYMFELVSPYNQVVIQYDKVHLYHIGTRNTSTGEEVDMDIGVEKPKMYKLTSLNECIRAVEAMNDETMEQEGFVVVDKNYNRIKIKSSKYFIYHYMVNNGAMSSKRVIEIIQHDEMEDAIKQFPMLAEDILKYNAAMAIYRYKVQQILNRARATYEEFDGDRRAASQIINTLDYPSAGYWGIDHEGNADDYIDSLKANNYVKVIENEVNKL